MYIEQDQSIKGAVLKVITNKTEYLLFILIHLAEKKDEGFISSREIAAEEGIPDKYIAQLVSLLGKKGWLDSARGVNGGVRLIEEAEEISVWEVTRLADKNFSFKDCLQGGCVLNKESCAIRPLWSRVQKEIKSILKDKSIADLIKDRQTDYNICC